jgi:hypothetical protein
VLGMQTDVGSRHGPRGVLVGAFGVKLEPAARVASKGLAQVITGPVGHNALGLVQQRGRRANAGLRLVGDTATGEHVDHLAKNTSIR